MRPGLYLLEESTARTLRRIALAVTDQSIVFGYVAILNAARQQIVAHGQGVRCGQLAHKAPDETDAQRLWIVAQGVGAHCLPAASLVYVAIAANEKIVRDVVPAATLDVEALLVEEELSEYKSMLSEEFELTWISRMRRTLIARFSELSVAVCAVD